MTLYRIALEDSAWSPGDVQREHRWHRDDLEAAMLQLRQLRLFEPCESTPSGVLALSPRTALAMLQQDSVTYVESALEVVRRASQATMDVVADLCGGTSQGPSSGRMRLIEGDERTSAFAEKMLGSARRELVALCDLAALSDGYMKGVWSALTPNVTARIVCHMPPARPYEAMLDAMRSTRAEVRITPPVAISLTVIDRRSAIIPLPVEENRSTSLLVLEDSSLISWLQENFNYFWAASTSLPGASTRGCGCDGTSAEHTCDFSDTSAPEMSSRHVDRPLLQLLAAGLTDKLISRRLGIHERTVRRRVSQLLAALGAESRFQGGVKAARAGWLAG